MSGNERLSSALHVLLHMAQQPERSLTSAEMAVCAGTNPVVIRRTFAGLREAGILRSARGHGGGWSLARPASEITLAQVQRALGQRIVEVAPAAEPVRCRLLGAVRDSMREAVAEAERVLERRLDGLTLADLAARVPGPIPRRTGREDGT